MNFTPLPIPYNGLFYQAFSPVIAMNLNTLPGLIPHSPSKFFSCPYLSSASKTPNYTYSSRLKGYAGCLHALANAPSVYYSFARTNPTIEATAGTPMLTVNYPVSNTSAFTLSSLYFGCLLGFGGQSVTAAPAQCQVELTGYQGNDNQVSNARQVCSQQLQ